MAKSGGLVSNRGAYSRNHDSISRDKTLDHRRYRELFRYSQGPPTARLPAPAPDALGLTQALLFSPLFHAKSMHLHAKTISMNVAFSKPMTL
ncbi:MAG: hypothetical protein WA231_22005, partial [Methylocella sp.]